MKQTITKILIILINFGVLFTSCKKDWLAAKPKTSLIVPTTISDYQALLDNSSNTNLSDGYVGFNSEQDGLRDLMSDDYYVSDNSWNSSTEFTERNAYIWASDIYGTANSHIEWNIPYARILISNIILEGIDKILPKDNLEQSAWNQLKGSAYFFRAYSHFDVAQQFCKPYNQSTANNDLGIPLRLSSDVNIRSSRASVQQTYDQIITDLKAAYELLPILKPDLPLYKLRPTKSAAVAMLARTYLSMSKYDSALFYANICLSNYNSLIDYNTLPTTLVKFQKLNAEVILHFKRNSYSLLHYTNSIVDSTLYSSYDVNDIRRIAFWWNRGTYITFLGGYDGGILFSGLATDEIYLIRAECYARSGNKDAAMNDLNTLLVTRWKKDPASGQTTYVNQTATDANDALRKILYERRKELCFRCLRWTDLRRLNMETQFATTLKRKINGQTYLLPPNDNRYVFPIPNDVIQLTGIQQNPR